MKGIKNQPTINRRLFVGNTLKLVTLGTVLGPLAQSCNNNKGDHKETTRKGTVTKKTNSSKTRRNKWNRNALVLNTKTNVLHFPTAVVYTYYDEIKSSHLTEIPGGNWDRRSESSQRLNKQQSGTILEIITLQELSKGVNDTALVIAIDTLSVAFEQQYEKVNQKNFRLHELLLQLISLNDLIPSDQKWATFTAKIKRPVQLRKRQQWMENENSFNERVNYILARRNEYITRLNKRAAKFTFT